MWCRRNIKTALLLCLVAAACGGQKQRVVFPAFYHWQTTLDISPTERNYIDALGCKKLYVKLLDIGRDQVSGEIKPYALLEASAPGKIAGLEIVPVVFITNEVFQYTAPDDIGWLAGKINDVLLALKKTPGIGPVNEIQFDCDWTPSTREVYFLFLQTIRGRLPENIQISATIRLHQYKFPEQTGVPPADRGMLMFYNTGDIDRQDAPNSIFNSSDAKKYLGGAPPNYALPLDVALPLFSWGLVYRNGELWKIIPEIAEETLSDESRFLKSPQVLPDQPGYYEVKNGTFLSGHYLRPGDALRVETISQPLLIQAARLASGVDLAEHTTVAYFHLDTSTIRRYPVPLLDSVCRMICFPEMKN